ncbi:hypothetical protein [Vreelandella olivaria]|uniref:hypothetical protein n=1 Tax=Vreelandella olivaria TaxID=390919 RepID=UPI00201EC7B2|nr:hypothetical protein [Halomonas olivaria]
MALLTRPAAAGPAQAAETMLTASAAPGPRGLRIAPTVVDGSHLPPVDIATRLHRLQPSEIGIGFGHGADDLAHALRINLRLRER